MICAGLADTLWNLKQYVDSLADANHALALSPKNAVAHIIRARAYEMRGNHELSEHERSQAQLRAGFLSLCEVDTYAQHTSKINYTHGLQDY
jgi:hypothetical protein